MDKIYSNEDIETVKRGKRLLLGKLYMYVYDPKYKDTLPYYDILALIVLTSFKPPYINGFNIHYIPFLNRLQFMKSVMQKLKNGKKLKYKDIKRAWQKAKLPERLVKYAYRTYLISHIRSNIKVFDYDDYYPIVKETSGKFKKLQDAAIFRDIHAKWKKDKLKLSKNR